MIRPEVLAPAGDRERLQAALDFGADAVYLGGQLFGMRQGAPNFDAAALCEAVSLAHARGVKVYRSTPCPAAGNSTSFRSLSARR